MQFSTVWSALELQCETKTVTTPAVPLVPGPFGQLLASFGRQSALLVTEANGTEGFAAYSQSSRRLNHKFAKATVLNHWHAQQALARSQAVTRKQAGSWKKTVSRSPKLGEVAVTPTSRRTAPRCQCRADACAHTEGETF